MSERALPAYNSPLDRDYDTAHLSVRHNWFRYSQLGHRALRTKTSSNLGTLASLVLDNLHPGNQALHINFFAACLQGRKRDRRGSDVLEDVSVVQAFSEDSLVWPPNCAHGLQR